MHALPSSSKRKLYDSRMRDQPPTPDADILLSGLIQAGIQIVVFPKYLPYPVFIRVINPVYFELDSGTVDCPLSEKKLFWSVS